METLPDLHEDSSLNKQSKIAAFIFRIFSDVGEVRLITNPCFANELSGYVPLGFNGQNSENS